MKLLTDENFFGQITRGLLVKKPDLDLVRVQDVGLMGVDDPTILEWAAQQNRVLLTHDILTIPNFAYERIRQGLPMPGVVEVPDHLPIGRAIEEILILIECSTPEDLENRVEFLPL